MTATSDPLFITSNYSRILARVLRMQERDLPRLLRGTGLPDTVMLPGDETRLSGPQQLRIIQNIWQLNDAPEAGLRLGRQLDPSTHGPIGYLVLSSPDLISAIRALRDFLPLRIAILQLGLETSGDWLRCSMQIRIAAPPAEKRLILEGLALAMQALVESVLGKPFTSGRFEFEFPAPGYHKLYDDYFHSPVVFGQGKNQLLVPADLLTTPNSSGEPDSYALARDLCQKLLAQVPAISLSMTDRVRRILLSTPPATSSEESVARALFVSKRTLARRLIQEKTGYRRLREELSAELAGRHLRESELSVEAIAALLGYHDSANFRRAFRRWYGLSPSAFRHAATAGALAK